ncbi:MAG: deoxyribose-phosphate aldolase [Candidatus Aerophobetes bacterium]|nr:deoxyribose-phosphate aldolase [Candidatus Aerophobetes bacterium]
MTKEELARMMDTSLIKIDATETELRNFIEKSKKYPFAAVAVDLFYIPLTFKLLKGTGIPIVAPISYPLGGMTTEAKVYQAEYAVKNGAMEMDMSINFAAFWSRDYDTVRKDIEAVVKVADGRIVKAVIYVPEMTDEEKVEIAKIARDAGARFIKTCCGFGCVTKTRDVRVIKEALGDEIKVMVAGGVRTAKQALAMIEAGVDRIASSTPFDILEGVETL